MPPTAYVILGMLRIGAESGYDIKKAVEVSTRFFWKISEARIYPMLATLESNGLILGHDAPQGRRRRRVYELTDEGEEALAVWLSADEPYAFEVRDVTMLKLFLADAAPEASAIEIVRRLIGRSEMELVKMRAQEQPATELAESGGVRYPAIALQTGMAVHEALVEIGNEIEAELVAGRS